MLKQKLFDEVSSKLSDLLATSPAKDVEKNMRAMLGNAFNRLDLVTREEFDVQQQVLLRTREKLSALEVRVTALEEKLGLGTDLQAAPTPTETPTEEPAAIVSPTASETPESSNATPTP